MISKIALDAGKKITVPVADVDPLNVPAELSDVRQQWTDVRKAFKETLDELPDEELIYCYFSHPLAGNFTCQDRSGLFNQAFESSPAPMEEIACTGDDGPRRE